MEFEKFRLNSIKIEYLEFKFSIALNEADVEVKLVTQTIPNRESFKYFGSVIQDSEKIDDDITHRIKVA